jgi:hypothetical protein
MSGTVNRNVAPVSAYAENRIPAKPLLKDALRAQESPQTNTLTPGQHDASVEEQNKSESINERKIENFDQEMSKNDFQQSLDELSARAGRKPENVETSSSLGTAKVALDIKTCQDNLDSNFEAKSGNESSEVDEEQLINEKKAVAPALSGDRNGFPATILSDMKEYIESMKPCKFIKNDNIASKMIHKFKKTLVCPKCEVLHGHTYQGVSSNQFGGTAPYKCKSSIPQLLMMLPQDLIVAIGKIYKTSSPKDATLFSTWLGSSKAVRKEEIIKNLNFEMQIDYQEAEYVIEEELEDENMQEQYPSQSQSQVSKDTFESFSDAEFRVAITEELIALRNRIASLESENKLLRQENAVLKKYNSSRIQIKDPKLPSSTTSLASVDTYLEVAKVYTPQPVILKRTKHDTVSESIYKPKPRPDIDLSLFTASNEKDKEKRESSKLVFIYFKGLLRRRQSEYRALFDKIGFGGYKARDILFLSDDFMQVLTYEDCVDELVSLIGKFIPAAKFVKDADPTDPTNYESHGRLSKKFLEEQYFVTMEGAVQRFKKLAVEKPFLKRTLYFLEKVVSTRNIKYEKSPEQPKVFLMNSFLALDKLAPDNPKPAPVVEAPVVSDQAPMEIS